MNENGFRNDATADTLQIWKWTEIWIACNPVALTNCDPHEFDLPIKEIKGVNNPANFMMKAVGGAAFCRDRNYALGMQ